MTLALACRPAWAGGPRSGADFLEMETGARPAAMGGAFTAVADDVHAVRWNPAGMGQIQRTEVAFGEKKWFHNVAMHQLSASRKLGSRWFGGLDLGFIDYGKIEKRDNQSRNLESYGARDMVVTLAGARDLVGPVWIGGALKIIQREIESESARTFAADLAAHAAHGPWRFGATIQNLGQPLTFRSQSENLPVLFRAGAARRIGERWLAAADVDVTEHAGARLRLGTEFSATRVRWSDLVVRAGYSAAKGPQGGITVGFGVIGFNWEFGYAFKAYGPLESGHWIGLGYRFTRSRPRVTPVQYEAQQAQTAYATIMKWYRQQAAAGKISRRWGTTVLERVIERYEPLGIDVGDALGELSRLKRARGTPPRPPEPGARPKEEPPEDDAEDPDIPSLDPLLKIPR
ncbi:MAG: PorV/PorQ family protein [Elusimicrobia bacterium]|nr:PorV/PorQ family protein [Elusimicrobiota bacterium]